MDGEHDGPFPGPSPFSRSEARLFFGRDAEASKLVSMIIAHPVALLYAQSGAGKTSLINAKVIPLLEQRGCQVVGPTRVGGEIPAQIDPEKVTNVFRLGVLLGLEGASTSLGTLAGTRLPDYLSGLGHNIPAEGRLPPPRVLIIDQFEELFTSNEARWREREEFFEELGEACEADRRLRVLLAMREEYIGGLAPYVSALPESLRTRFRLERLSEPSALLAARKPVELFERSFAEGVAEQLVQNLRAVPVRVDGGMQTVIGEYVEPVQLQIVCRSVWEALPNNVRVIDHRALERCGSVDDVLSEYYESCLEDIVSRGGVGEGALRRWFEDKLITPEGTRGTVYSDASTTGGLSTEIVRELEVKRLVRPEMRAGVPWYELTHDRFIEPIRQSNRDWKLRRSAWVQALERGVERWLEQGRRAEDLLTDAELASADRWREEAAAASADNRDVQDFLDASRRAQEDRHRRKKARANQVRQRNLLVLVSILSVSLIALIALGNYAREKAVKLADNEKALADLANKDRGRYEALLATFVASKLAERARGLIASRPERAAVLASQAARALHLVKLPLTTDVLDTLTAVQDTRSMPLPPNLSAAGSATPSAKLIANADMTQFGILVQWVALLSVKDGHLRQTGELPMAVGGAFTSDGGLVIVDQRGARKVLGGAVQRLGPSTADAHLGPPVVFDRDATHAAAIVQSRPAAAQALQGAQDAQGRIQVLAIKSGHTFPVPPELSAGFTVFALAAGPTIAIGTQSGAVSTFQLTAPKGKSSPGVGKVWTKLFTFSRHGAVTAVDTANGHVASAGGDGVVVAWNDKNGVQTARMDVAGRESNAAWRVLKFNQDGTSVAGVRDDGLVMVWQAQTGRVVFSCRFPNVYPMTSLNQKLDQMATVGDGSLFLYSLAPVDADKVVNATQSHPFAKEYADALGDTVPDLPKGIAEARSGHLLEARESVLKARQWPGIQFNSEVAVLKELVGVYMQALAASVRSWVEDGDVERVNTRIDEVRRQVNAQAKEAKSPGDAAVLVMDETLVHRLRAEALLSYGRRLIDEKKYTEAATALRQARNEDTSVDLTPGEWNSLCWLGSLAGKAKDVLWAGKRAVKLAPDDSSFQDTLGVALVLAGEGKKAIEHFQKFVADRKERPAERSRRARWIRELEAGKADPVTPDIPALRRQ